VITLKNVASEDKIPAVANEAMVQGVFGNIVGYDGDDALIDKADGSNDDDVNKLYLILKYAYRVEGTEHDDWNVIADEARVLRVPIRNGQLVEDNELATNSGTANWSGASVGAEMILNTAGFLTLNGAGDDPGAGATIIAKFIRIQNGIIFYELVADNVNSA
jgi:hypothetical protein